jgi:dihydrofolate reductase
VLLGRVTYERFAAVWPSQEGEFADKFNTMPKYVVSSTLQNPEWTNSTVLDGDVVDEVAKLRQRRDGTSWSTAAHSWCRRWSSTISSRNCA